jgi:hypothetical protein
MGGCRFNAPARTADCGSRLGERLESDEGDQPIMNQTSRHSQRFLWVSLAASALLMALLSQFSAPVESARSGSDTDAHGSTVVGVLRRALSH